MMPRITWVLADGNTGCLEQSELDYFHSIDQIHKLLQPGNHPPFFSINHPGGEVFIPVSAVILIKAEL